MAWPIVFLASPVLVFVSLALLPRGRPAFLGIVGAALGVGLLGPGIAPEDGTGFGTLLLWVFGGAVALAALAQVLRLLRAPGGEAPPYPLRAAFVFLGAALPAALYLGLT